MTLQRNRRCTSHRTSLAAALLIGLTFVCGTANGADEETASAKARAFLDAPALGSDVLAFLHYGARYRGHDFIETDSVVDGLGRRIDGKFALRYQFRWADDGVTDLAFLCDSDGAVYRVQVLSTNAELSQPFTFANLAIRVMGNLVVASAKGHMSEIEHQLIQKLVDNADAKGLMEIWLRIQQAARR